VSGRGGRLRAVVQDATVFRLKASGQAHSARCPDADGPAGTRAEAAFNWGSLTAHAQRSARRPMRPNIFGHKYANSHRRSLKESRLQGEKRFCASQGSPPWFGTRWHLVGGPKCDQAWSAREQHPRARPRRRAGPLVLRFPRNWRGGAGRLSPTRARAVAMRDCPACPCRPEWVNYSPFVGLNPSGKMHMGSRVSRLLLWLADSEDEDEDEDEDDDEDE